MNYELPEGTCRCWRKDPGHLAQRCLGKEEREGLKSFGALRSTGRRLKQRPGNGAPRPTGHRLPLLKPHGHPRLEGPPSSSSLLQANGRCRLDVPGDGELSPLPRAPRKRRGKGPATILHILAKLCSTNSVFLCRPWDEPGSKPSPPRSPGPSACVCV